MNRRDLLLYAALTAMTGAVLIGFLTEARRLTGGVLGAPLDDTWIHFQYARNLAHGHGFSYNPGQPTPGSTAPLWTVLLAGPARISAELMPTALALSAAFWLATVLLTAGWARRLTSGYGPAFVAGAGVALNGRMAWAALSGMEATAFAALSVAAVWAFTRRGWRWWVGLLFGLAGQLRPEGHALFALAALLAWLQLDDRPLAERVRLFLLPVVAYGVVAAPYAVFSLSTTGLPLPNTFYAKSTTELFFSVRTLRETLALHAQDNLPALLLVPLGWWLLWRHSRLSAAWLVALPLLTALIVDQVWHHGRYTLPLVPFQMLAAALGLFLVQLRVPRRWSAATTGVLALVVLAGGAVRLPYWAQMLGNNVREIEEIDVALGRWLADNTPPNAVIAVDDIGAIGYLSQRRIIDLHGLISPEMWPVIRDEPFGRPRNEALARLLSAAPPDYLAVFPVWRYELAHNPHVAAPVHEVTTPTHTMVLEQTARVYAFTPPYIATAAPDAPVNAVFGGAVQLLGVDWGAPETPGVALALTLYWQSVAPLAERYDVFVHVVDAGGTIVAQADREPVAGLAPTSRWQPGDIVRDPLTIALPDGPTGATLTVNVGLFLRETGARLPLDGGGDSLRLGQFTLP